MNETCNLVVTEFGVGFLDPRDGTLRKPFAVQTWPLPRELRPATEEEARSFYIQRAAVRRELVAYYDRADRAGRSTGD